MKLVYLGGPIKGVRYEGAQSWRVHFETLLADGIKALGPMRGEAHLATESGVILDSYEDTLLSNARAIYIKDRFDVWRCDAVVVNLLGAATVSIGSVGEIFWADAWDKPCIVVMETNGNVHDHCMIREAASLVVPRLEDAADIVNTMLTAGV